MLNVNEFRNYITNIQASVAEITASQTVMDDSQLSRFLEDQLTDAYICLGVIPKHNPNGNVDALRTKDTTSILVLKKVVRSDQDHENFLDTINEAQEVTKKVIEKLLFDFKDDERCDFIRYLIPSSLDINPIWGLNSCDGYQIDFSLNTVF
ncbi:hypothetical protein [Tenacibaculum soleae]|uniref:hypothetical protein n=1 Tax=Tenacibaculum soleae TaxID=447689 RepID=UPI002300BAFE|nr:hypothetical protein [Tenacibaculum soleae]